MLFAKHACRNHAAGISVESGLYSSNSCSCVAMTVSIREQMYFAVEKLHKLPTVCIPADSAAQVIAHSLRAGKSVTAPCESGCDRDVGLPAT